MPDRLPASRPDLPTDHTIDPAMLSPAAVDVTRTLRNAGYEALLVGGCVRDLLLGIAPKDYDVATDATPEQVARVFRRARIVGRRFRIVHVRMGREIIEVTTFRGAPVDGADPEQTEHGRILADNVWGDLDSDAQRRDFTVNALYYDPLNNEGIDHVDGLADLEDRVLRMIGDPVRRFAEDPVRMVRAVRFQAKLGFALDPATRAALRECCHLLAGVPAARMFDEVLKLFQHGHGAQTCALLHEYGMLELLFPVLAEDLADGGIPEIVERALHNTDARVREGKAVIAPFLFAAMLWPPVEDRFTALVASDMPPIEALHRAAEQVFEEECQAVAIPRRVSSVVREIWEQEYRLGERRPRSVRGLMENRRFRAAYDFLLLRQAVGERGEELASWWTRIQEVSESEASEMIAALPGGGKRRSRRPRKRKPTQ